jgi:hypothetical protein
MAGTSPAMMANSEAKRDRHISMVKSYLSTVCEDYCAAQTG